jgi:hypothetical protein
MSGTAHGMATVTGALQAAPSPAPDLPATVAGGGGTRRRSSVWDGVPLRRPRKVAPDGRPTPHAAKPADAEEAQRIAAVRAFWALAEW